MVSALIERKEKDTAELHVHECHFALLMMYEIHSLSNLESHAVVIEREGLDLLDPRASGLHMKSCTRPRINSSTSADRAHTQCSMTYSQPLAMFS